MKHFLMISIFIFFTSSSLTGCSLVSQLSDEGDPPIISSLTVTPNNGAAPLLSAINWKIVSTSKEPITCTLDYGNGETQTLEECENISDRFYTYQQAGGYVLTLTAATGKHETKRTVPITVQAVTTPDSSFTITELTVTPKDGTAPLLTAVKWQIEGATTPVTCDLDFGDGNKKTVENCGQVTDTFHTYEQAGGYTLVLTAKDGTTSSSKSFPVTVQVTPSE